MKYGVPTLSIILAMDHNVCYTPITAARLYFSANVERSRRSLRSLMINHSFEGYRKRKNESHQNYRVRLIKEYGPLGKFIRIESKVGRNGKRYSAFSGCIFKWVIDTHGLHVAALAFCHVLLVGDYRPAPWYLPRTEVNAVLFAEIHDLLQDHAKQLGREPSRRDWVDLVPPKAFDAALLWAVGKTCPVLTAKPDKALTLIFLGRLGPGRRLMPHSCSAVLRIDLSENLAKEKVWDEKVAAVQPLEGRRPAQIIRSESVAAVLPETKEPVFLPIKTLDRQLTVKGKPTRAFRKSGLVLVSIIVAAWFTVSVLKETPTSSAKMDKDAVVLPSYRLQLIHPDGENLNETPGPALPTEPPIVPTVERMTPPEP